MRENSVIRVVRGYEKDGDQQKMEFNLDPSVSIKELQEIFGESKGNPMYDCYPIGKHQMEKLKPLIKEEFDINRFDFFLECDEISDSDVD